MLANHWFTAKILTVFGFSVQPWDEDEAHIAPLHLCSEECVHRALNAYLMGDCSAVTSLAARLWFSTR